MPRGFMRIISFNANGIRSAARKGFFEWLAQQEADMVCVQETKAQIDKLDGTFSPQGWHTFYCDAEKPGYSGTAIYTRHQPDSVHWGLGFAELDHEGRCIEARFGNLSVFSLYLPSGTSGDVRQQIKFRFLDWYAPRLAEMRESGREVIICGDWNIAHKEIDLKNHKSNQKNSGFLPEERAWLDTLFDDIGWVDGFRVVNDKPDEYTWWSNRGQAWAKNVGWRIDYHMVTPNLRERITGAWVYRDARFSDHAPLILDYDLDLAADHGPG